MAFPLSASVLLALDHIELVMEAKHPDLYSDLEAKHPDLYSDFPCHKL